MTNQEKQMESELLWKQYDRFIYQFREEVRELYWLFNFFFVIDGGLFVLFIQRNFVKGYLEDTVVLVGLIISILWFWVTRKQMLTKNWWIEKVKKIDSDFISDHRMWPDEKYSPLKWLSSFIFGNIRLVSVMLMIPLGFIVLWICLLRDVF